MGLTEIYKTLFAVAAFIGLFFLLSDLIEYLLSVYYKKKMYYTLDKIWNLFVKNEPVFDYPKEKLRKILREECKCLHFKYVIRNKFLRNSLYSPDDLLKEFITTISGDKGSALKFEILYKESENGIKPHEVYKEKSTIRKFEIVSVAVTVVGTIVTVLSWFL